MPHRSAEIPGQARGPRVPASAASQRRLSVQCQARGGSRDPCPKPLWPRLFQAAGGVRPQPLPHPPVPGLTSQPGEKSHDREFRHGPATPAGAGCRPAALGLTPSREPVRGIAPGSSPSMEPGQDHRVAWLRLVPPVPVWPNAAPDPGGQLPPSPPFLPVAPRELWVFCTHKR